MSVQSIKRNYRIPAELAAAIKDAAHRERKSETQFLLDLARNKLNRMGYRLTIDSFRYDPNWADGIDKIPKKRQHFSKRVLE